MSVEALLHDRPLSQTDYDDGTYYPSSDGQPLAETGIHVDALLALYALLKRHYRNRDDVLITGNQFWYWQKGNPKARRAPDVMVVFGVDGNFPRNSYRSWLERNATPAAIFEMSSRKTIKKDLNEKYVQYQALGVREYFLFDPEEKVLKPGLQGFRLSGGKYVRLKARNGELTSKLGFRIRKEGLFLRLIDVASGEPILTEGEEAERQREALEQMQQRLATAEAELARFRKLLGDKSRRTP